MNHALLGVFDIPHLDRPLHVDFLVASSYGNATVSSGTVRLVYDPETSLEGKHILLVEDIVDSGLTAQHLLKTLAKKKPKSLNVCALLAKHERRVVNVHVEYVGFTVPNQYIVGYGLDYRQKYRNLPFIGVLAKHMYE